MELSHRTGVPGAVLVLIVAAGAVVAFAGFGFAVALEDVMDGHGVVGADPVVQRFLIEHRTVALTDFFRVITQLGGPAVVVPVVVAVAALLFWRHRRLLAFGLVLAVGGVAVVVAVVKTLVNRDRPPPINRLTAASGASFPSGHSAIAIAFYGALAWIVVELAVKRRRSRFVLYVVALGLGALVGFSRAYLGVHWASDVVSGWLLGIAWLTATVALCTLLPTLSDRDHREPSRGSSGCG